MRAWQSISFPSSYLYTLKKKIFKIFLLKNKSIYYTYVYHLFLYFFILGFPDGSDGKESACNSGEMVPIPGSGKSPGEGNGNPIQYSWLENFMVRGA